MHSLRLVQEFSVEKSKFSNAEFSCPSAVVLIRAEPTHSFADCCLCVAAVCLVCAAVAAAVDESDNVQ